MGTRDWRNLNIRASRPNPPLLSPWRNRYFRSTVLPILKVMVKVGRTGCASLFPKEAWGNYISLTYTGLWFSYFEVGKVNPILHIILSFWLLLAKALCEYFGTFFTFERPWTGSLLQSTMTQFPQHTVIFSRRKCTIFDNKLGKDTD